MWCELVIKLLLTLLIGLEIHGTPPQLLHFQADVWRNIIGRNMATQKDIQLVNILQPLKVCAFMINAAFWSQSQKTVRRIAEELQEFLHSPTANFNSTRPTTSTLDYSPSWILSQPEKFRREEAVRRFGQNCFVFAQIPAPEMVQKEIEDKEEFWGGRFYGLYMKQAEDFFFFLAASTDDLLFFSPTDERSKPGQRTFGPRNLDYLRRNPLNYFVILVQNSLYSPQQEVVQLKFKCGDQVFCTKTIEKLVIRRWGSHRDVLKYFKNSRKDFQGSVIQVGTWDLDSWTFRAPSALKNLEKMELKNVLNLCMMTSGNGSPLKSVLHLVNHVNGTPEGIMWGVQSHLFRSWKGIIQFRHYHLKHWFEDHRIYYDSYHWLILYGENFEADRPSFFYDLVRPIEKWLATILALFILAMFILFKSRLFGAHFLSLELSRPFLRVLSPLLGQILPIGRTTFRGQLLFTLWTLASFFLDNYYLGSMHSLKVIPGTRPVPGKALQDLLREGYTIYPFHPSHVDYYGYQLNVMKQDARDKPQLFADYDKLMGSLLMDSSSSEMSGYRQIYGMDKSAILLSTDELKRDENIAPVLFKKNYYKCKQIYWQQWITWTFESPNVDSILTPFRRLLTGGIVTYWWNWRSYFYIQKRQQNVLAMFGNEPEMENWNDDEVAGVKNGRPNPTKMSESLIQATFCLLGIGVGVGCVLFCMERLSQMLVHQRQKNTVHELGLKW